MSVSREYYDEEGNYWQIETPHYIPPKEAIKNPDYIRGFISAADRKKAERNRIKYHRMTQALYAFMGAAVLVLGIMVILKG